MNDVQRIAARLQQLHAGDAWHGAPIRAVLDGIDATLAGARLVPHVHTIFELVLHMTAWIGEVRRRVEGGVPGLPEEGDWPAVTDPSRVGWEKALAAHAAAHEDLLARLVQFAPEKLETTVGGEREAAAGTGVTFEIMLNGLAEHEAYHCGQVGFIKKLIQGAAVPKPAATESGAALRTTTPVFGVADVGATMRWYIEKLGFTGDPFPEKEPWTFAILRRDGVEIMLQRRSDAAHATPAALRSWSTYVRMRGVRRFHDEIAVRVPLLRGLERMPYGETEFEVADPGGHVLVFSEHEG